MDNSGLHWPLALNEVLPGPHLGTIRQFKPMWAGGTAPVVVHFAAIHCRSGLRRCDLAAISRGCVLDMEQRL